MSARSLLFAERRLEVGNKIGANAVVELWLEEKGSKMIRVYAIVIIVLLASASPAAAYIDPVTGSIVIQALVGGAAAALVTVRQWRNSLLNLFRRDKGGSTTTANRSTSGNDAKDR